MDNKKHNQTRNQNILSVMSWNIRSRDTICGNKTKEKDFNDLLNACDIFCLQETRKEIKIPNYICYNKLRPNGRGGGVCIGIKRSLSNGVTKINTLNKTDTLGIKLNKNYFKTDKDIILLNCYIPPGNSSYLKKQEHDPFDSLSSILEKIDTSDSIILCGDFNARTGGLEDRTLCENIPGIDFTEDHSSDHISTERNCMDSTNNAHGKNLIDLSIENNLTLINGRISGNLFGDLTYVNYAGGSVIDYFLVSQSLVHSTNYLKIKELNPYSDHKPLVTSFSFPVTCLHINRTFNFSDAPRPFLWDSDSTETFSDAQSTPEVVNETENLNKIAINTKEDVLSFNQSLSDLIQKISSTSLAQKRKPPPWTNKNIWFDGECRSAKRVLNKDYKEHNKDQNSNILKQKLFDSKRNYRKLLNYKKRTHLINLNKEIQDTDNKSVNWAKFKKLKGLNTDSISFDNYDLENFYIFFKKLYYDNKPLQDDRCASLRDEIPHFTDTFYSRPEINHQGLLDDYFNFDELKYEIRKLKSGKSVSLDLISNEMIKNLNGNLQLSILNLYNGCLRTGTYPWLTSTMTPLHKSGDKYNPDNYRAIALGSCLSKLYSNLLLSRIQKFRNLNCPDTPNQLGFTPNAQTSDHILTLKTLIDKYTANRGTRLYTCFVDYRKAFDSVARDALLYKLAKLGIGGKIFQCLKSMYENSGTKIKLINKLSDHIILRNGVEQGHPLSPELFKIYILDLSHQLEQILGNFPHLSNVKISHLLWADDLVLLALDELTLQAILDVLSKFCDAWGLQVNPKKTKILIFNKSGRLLKPSINLKIGNEIIETTKSYCYLGIVFTPSGTFTHAINELKKKAMKATFSLKRFVNHKFISVSTTFKLFDSLILPILTYASQVLFPFSKTASCLVTTKSTSEEWQSNWLRKLSIDPFEKLHLRFIKWVLGVHRKASNIGTWGESGRHPIGSQMLKQTINYFNRISRESSPSSLVHLSFLEQKSNNMKWFTATEKLIKAHGAEKINIDGIGIWSAGISAKSSKTMFESIWKGALVKSPKLDFYETVKQTFSKEKYLDLLDFDLRKTLTWIRISSHRLPIERGRYVTPPIARDKRICEVCRIHKKFSEVGNETHFLFDCISSLNNRNYLTPHNLITITSKNLQVFSELHLEKSELKNLAIFVKRSYMDFLKES